MTCPPATTPTTTEPQVVIVSFGYLHAPPTDGVDVLVDLRRHFKDPHVDPALRHQTVHHRDLRRAVVDR